MINLKEYITFFKTKGNIPIIIKDTNISKLKISLVELILEICFPAFTKRKIPGNIPIKETKIKFKSLIIESPKRILIIKKGKIGTSLTKNKKYIQFFSTPILIFLNVFLNFFSKNSFIVYLDIKKHTDAPNEEAIATKKNASKKLKIDPIKIEKAAAKGRDKEAIIT